MFFSTITLTSCISFETLALPKYHPILIKERKHNITTTKKLSTPWNQTSFYNHTKGHDDRFGDQNRYKRGYVDKKILEDEINK